MKDIEVIGGWNTNADMIADVAQLGFFHGDVLDLTFGMGGFWKVWRPVALETNDNGDEKTEASWNEDFRATHWNSRSFGTVVFDPPYKMQGKPSSPDMDRRFGTEKRRTRNEILTLLVGGVAEAARLSDEILMVKCMDQVNAGKVRWMTDVATDVARACEFRKITQFIFQGGRAQPDGTTQKHPRNAHSTLLVFGRK